MNAALNWEQELGRFMFAGPGLTKQWARFARSVRLPKSSLKIVKRLRREYIPPFPRSDTRMAGETMRIADLSPERDSLSATWDTGSVVGWIPASNSEQWDGAGTAGEMAGGVAPSIPPIST